MKSCIRRYCNEGHVLSAHDMRTALMQRPVRGTTACVSSIDESQQTLGVNKIESFSSFHNFKFEKEGVRLWKAYGIGPGKHIEFDNLISKPQISPGLKIEEDFSPFKDTRIYKTASLNEDSEQDDCLFYCSDHISERTKEKRTVYDNLRLEWAAKFQSVDIPTRTLTSAVPCLQKEGKKAKKCDLDSGWALHNPKTGTARFSANVKDYLTKRFDIGERTGNKVDPAQVAADMRTARTPDGSRLFSRSEWLKKSQVQGFFSRLASSRRKKANTEIDGEEATAEAEEEERLRLLDSLSSELGLKHPICFDTYCLCDCLQNGQLQKFSVAMLKEILRHFDISFLSRDRKKELLTKLSSFLESCECYREKEIH